jgi:dTDP-glucose 4,6-dehydratase
MSLKTARYAVIGSNCFTGSHFVDALVGNLANTVIGISRSPEKSSFYLPYKSKHLDNFKFHQLDLVRQADRLMALLDEFKPDYVINVAALSEVVLSNYHPEEYFEVNTLGTVRLCSRLREKSYLKRYLHISSAEIYGPCATAIPEDTLLNPSTPYAVSKAAADMYLLSLAKNFDFPVTLIRSTNVYGKHQQLFKIIPRAVINIKNGKKISLHGGGKAIKSFIHIKDVVRGALKVLEVERPSTIYHYSTRNNATIAEVIQLVCKFMNKDFNQVAEIVDERLGQDAKYSLDCSRAARELGWTPQISFEQGVQEVVSWIEQEWSQIAGEPLEYIHKV